MVCDTILMLSREGFRDACQRTSPGAPPPDLVKCSQLCSWIDGTVPSTKSSSLFRSHTTALPPATRVCSRHLPMPHTSRPSALTCTDHTQRCSALGADSDGVAQRHGGPPAGARASSASRGWPSPPPRSSGHASSSCRGPSPRRRARQLDQRRVCRLDRRRA